jgi:diketogulonate reductase-like aldo/keto reductase
MSTQTVRMTHLPSGEPIPVLGQGSWGLAERPWRRDEEIAALRLGIDLGMTVIDTAEMYADGGAEELIGEAVEARRDEVFLVSKVLPHHATLSGTVSACDDSLRRLRTDRLDLYLLHWRGRVPLQETIEAFMLLIDEGKIRYWGVSNFDLKDMTDLVALPGGSDVATNQILYNLTRRGPEWDLLPWCHEQGIPVMAYSPIEQGRLLTNLTLRDIAFKHDMTPAQVALAWVLRRDDTVAIPRAGTREHVWEDHAALVLQPTEEDLRALDKAFPPPLGPRPLEML